MLTLTLAIDCVAEPSVASGRLSLVLSSHLLWNIIYSVSMWRSAEWGAHVPQCVCGRERAIDGGQFLPSSMWVLGEGLKGAKLGRKGFYLL